MKMGATEGFMKYQIEQLEEENKKLKEEVKKWKMVADENGTGYDMLEEEYKKLKEELQHYKNTEKQYTEEEQELIDLDYGTGYTKKFVK